MDIKLPSFVECETARKNMNMNPLHVFIYEFEPVSDDYLFRSQLEQAIKYAIDQHNKTTPDHD